MSRAIRTQITSEAYLELADRWRMRTWLGRVHSKLEGRVRQKPNGEVGERAQQQLAGPVMLALRLECGGIVDLRSV